MNFNGPIASKWIQKSLGVVAVSIQSGDQLKTKQMFEINWLNYKTKSHLSAVKLNMLQISYIGLKRVYGPCNHRTVEIFPFVIASSNWGWVIVMNLIILSVWIKYRTYFHWSWFFFCMKMAIETNIPFPNRMRKYLNRSGKCKLFIQLNQDYMDNALVKTHRQGGKLVYWLW